MCQEGVEKGTSKCSKGWYSFIKNHLLTSAISMKTINTITAKVPFSHFSTPLKWLFPVNSPSNKVEPYFWPKI